MCRVVASELNWVDCLQPTAASGEKVCKRVPMLSPRGILHQDQYARNIIRLVCVGLKSVRDESIMVCLVAGFQMISLGR